MAMQARSIVGRDRELEAIRAFVGRLRHGPAALVLSGHAGIGKTTLWQAGIDAAAAQGIRILVTRAGESETTLSYSALGDLFGSVEQEVFAPLPPPQRRALEVALLRADAAGPSPDQRAVAVATLAMLRIIAIDDPVLIAIDDVQWVDASSARVLSFVARRIHDEHVGVLTTIRLGEPRDDPIGVERAMAPIGVESVRVGPFSADALHALIRERTGAELSHPVVRRVHDASEGNPFFALEIAKELVRRGVPRAGEVLPVPDDVVSLLQKRVSALPSATRNALLIAASTSRPTESLVRLAGLGDQTAIALTKAEQTGVISTSDGEISFTHPLFASAIYTAAPAARRRDVHQRIAAFVVDAEERARHLALSSSGPDEAVARGLDDAARRARSRGAAASAAELSELARRMTPPDDGNAAIDRMVQAAEHHYDAGDAGRSWALLEEAIEMCPPGRDRAQIVFRLAAVSWMDMRRVETLCDRALREAGEDADLLSAIREHLAWVGIYRGDLAYAATHAAESLARAREGQDRSVLAASVSTFGMVEFLRGRPAQTLMAEGNRLQDAARTRAGGIEDMSYTTSRTNHGLQLMWAGELDAAREILEAELKTYEERGRYLYRDEILAYLAEVECRAGDLGRATQHAREAYEIDVESGRHTGRGHILFPKALVAAHAGDVDEARSSAEEGLRVCLAYDDQLDVACHRAVLGFLELSLSDAAAAKAHLDPAVAFVRAMDSPEPGIIPCVADAIEAHVLLGEVEEAEGLLDDHERKARALDRPWALATAARCRALLLAARGEIAAAFAALDDAVVDHERMAQPLELGRMWLVRGEIARRAKQKRPARDALERAGRIFERLGARLWSARARSALERVGGGVRAGELTPTEWRIAELVAQGKTNREVADALFISVKTVEANLSRVFHKVGVRSRAELIRHLITVDEPKTYRPR